jgi:large subunit ribosomal protein L41
MSLNLFLTRHTNVYNNVMANTCRKRVALTFRKTLGVYNYKVKPHNYYKNPHAIELRKKEQLKAEQTDSATRKIKAMERFSVAPFGKHTSKGKFVLDHRRIPNYNIPDLSDFPLKPYVSFKNELMPDEFANKLELFNRDYLMNTVKSQLMQSGDEKVRELGKEIFETEEGKEIIDEYFKKKERKTKLRIVNF